MSLRESFFANPLPEPAEPVKKEGVISLENVEPTEQEMQSALSELQNTLDAGRGDVEKSDLGFEIRAEPRNAEPIEVHDYLIAEEERSLTPKERFERVQNALALQGKEYQGRRLERYPHTVLLGDSDHLENQQIDFVKTKTGVRMNFKLVNHLFENAVNKCFDAGWKKGGIDYCSEVLRGSCYQEEKDGIIVKVSTGGDLERHERIRSFLGMVEIVIPEEMLHEEGLAEKLNLILEEEFDVPRALEYPDKESEKKYAEARYRWHHKLPADVPVSVGKLRREDVLPGYGYNTFTEKGKAKEYERISPFAVYHTLYHPESLRSIVKTGGLYSTSERFRMNLGVTGASSVDDMRFGGGDSIFTRVITEKMIQEEGDSGRLNDLTLVFKPSIVERTDWYVYNEDRWGNTDPGVFETRMSPEQLFSSALTSNEEMFRAGISIEQMAAVACPTEQSIITTFLSLRRYGISEIKGRPVEEFLILASSKEDFIKISKGEDVGQKTSAQIISEARDAGGLQGF